MGLVTEEKEVYIIINEFLEVYCGMIGGYPKFTKEWKNARQLETIYQFNHVQSGTKHQLERLYL